MTCVIVLMGVSGSGKTTVGLALAKELDIPFYDGDDFHPPKNVAKMASGIPLDDDDRSPWLRRLNGIIADHLERREPAVLACSALKKKYRDLLRRGNAGVRFVHLYGSLDLLLDRMRARQTHFMKAQMLQSQLDTLEPPDGENGFEINVDQEVENIVVQVIKFINNAVGDDGK